MEQFQEQAPISGTSYSTSLSELSTTRERASTSSRIAEIIESFDDWVFSRLPILNSEIDNGSKGEINQFLSEGLSHVVSLSLIVNEIKEECISDVLGNLGMFVASCIAHGVLENEARMLPIKELCIRLADRSIYPPRDTLSSYINASELRNGKYKAFTLLEDEQVFIRDTKVALDLIDKALGEITQAVTPECGLSIEAMDKALEYFTQYQKVLQGFLRKDENGIEALRPDIFFKVLREYFPNLEIAGQLWGPPSAAYAAEIMEFDIRMGLTSSNYIENVRKRIGYFTLERRESIEDALTSPSLLDYLTDGIKEVGCPNQLLNNLKTRGLFEEAKAYVALVDQVGRAASSHWGLVINYLVKPHEQEEKNLSEIGKCPITGSSAYQMHVVDPEKGASGMAFEEVAEFRDLRRKHPMVMFLKTALAIDSAN